MEEENRTHDQALDELAAMRQRIDELETLQRTSLQVTSSLELSTVLEAIAESVLALVGASDCLIYLYDRALESFSFGTASGRWLERDTVLPPRPSGLTATVAREGRPVVINDAGHHPLYASPEAQQWNIQAIAGFPLRWAGRLLGVLHVVFVEAHTFTTDELNVLGLLADQAAIAIENSQLYARAQQEIAERVQAEEELRQLKEFNESIIQNTAEGIFVIDADGNFTFVNRSLASLLRYEVDQLVGQSWRVIVPPDQQPVAEAADERRARGASDRYELQLIRKDGTRVPVQVSGSPVLDPSTGQLLGTMGVFTDLGVRLQAEAELRKHRDHLEELVDERTAALTEANAQLQREIAERRHAEAERERLLVTERAQARRQAALFRLSAELAAAADEAAVCRRVVDGLRDTLGYDSLALFLVDQARGDRVLAASVGFDEPPDRLGPGQGLSERALLDGRLHYSPDVTQERRYLHGMGGSEVDVPVHIGGQPSGVLVAENKLRDAFNQDDFEVLTAAAQQAGLAIEKARLLAAERQRADELEALRTTMTDITTELELSTLLRAIVERAAGLVDATGGELGLYDDASEEIRIVVSHNLDKDYVGTRHALGEGAMGLVAESGEPLMIADYQTWERSAPGYAGVPMHAVLAVPLKVGRRLVGVITLATTDADRRFDAADLHLLALFAQQAAIAIENARLFSETERRVTELATLTDIGKALSSTLHVDEVLQLIYDQTRHVMHADDMLIMMYDEARHELECVFSTNPDDAPVGSRFPGDVGLVGRHVVKHGKTLLLTHNVVEAASKLGLEPVGQPAASWLGVPMCRGERVLGAIVVQHYTKPHVYDKSHQVLLESIASQAAIAIENARLFGQAQREIAERERAEAELLKSQEYLEQRVEERTAKLRESEERYRTLFDGVPVGLYRSTPGGEIVDANLALVEMMGYPSRESYLDVDSAGIYVNPHDRVQWQALMQREGVVRDFETRLRRYDGPAIWTKDTARAVKDEQGQVLYYEGSLEDITERKQAAEELRRYREHLEELVEERTAELRESEERYRTLFDRVPVALYRTTPTGQILDANRTFVQMSGCPDRQTLLTLNSARFYADPEEQARWRALMDQQGVVRDFESQLRRYDGTLTWCKDTARAVRDEYDKVLYYEGSLEDITQRKQFEEEIRRQKDYFEALFVNSPVAVMTADLDAKVVSWNPMAERLFGYTQQEAIGRHIDDLVANDLAVRDEALGYTHQLRTTGRIQATTKRTRKDGSLVDVEVLALPVTVAGEEAGYIGIYFDIGELQQARREAEAANQAKSSFLANMSHELRTPLNAILGFSQLMDGDANLTGEQQENLAIINRSGEHLLALINDVLEMSKIEAGRVTLQETSFDLHALLDTLEEVFHLRAAEKGLALTLDRAGSVPRYVVADEGKLRQVLSNLLGNAVKFTPEGTVALRVSALSPAVPHPQGRETLHFEVEDTGPGIAPEELEAVFEPFVQAASRGDMVPTQAREGTGLGLSISRQFVRLMGSDITASSELARGSCFRFDLQVGLAAEAAVEEMRPRRRVLGLAPGQRAPDGRPFRLLVVEDKETNRRLLIKLLESLGLEVQEATNGQEALQIWEQWQPHLIWMDMRMPVMDGHEATQRIKEMPGGQATIIIALTATAFEEDREQILLEGCDDFVRKPFRQDEIYDMLAEHLGIRFLFEEEPALLPPAGPVQPAYVPSAETLAALPAHWLVDLQQATTRADLHLILDLADQIRGHDSALADFLAGMARNYEYKKILTLIEQAGGQP